MAVKKMNSAFLWGGGFAANQMEGAYDEDGKGLCIADINELKTDVPIEKRNNEEVTTASVIAALQADDRNFPKRRGIGFYHTFHEDLKLLGKEGLGLNAYRTSINWARIFPNGDDEIPNEAGLAFYDRLIDEVLANGMEPMITMSHYEMPLNLTLSYSGWYAKETIGFFERYGRVLLDRYHGRVKKWILVNQINLITHESFNHLGIAEDKVENLTEAKYQGVINEMIACAGITEYSHAHYPDVEIGMMLCGGPAYPATCRPEDVLAAVRHNQMEYFYGDVLLRGKIPGYAWRFFRDRGLRIEVSEVEKEKLTHHCDFFSFSYYYTRLCDQKSYAGGNDVFRNPKLPANPWGWSIDPTGLRTFLNLFYDRYQCPIYITENGIGCYDEVAEDGQIHDSARPQFYREHIKQMKEALDDGVDLRGYFFWAPLDIVSCSSCEMSKRYGFIYTDLDDQGQGSGRRILKDSYVWAKKVIASQGEDLE